MCMNMYIYVHNVQSFSFIQDTITISEDCINGKDIRASYELIYITATGTLNTTCIMDGTECSNGKCHHQLKNNIVDNRCRPPVSQFGSEAVTMSIAAKNVLGRSNFAKSRIISESFEVELS